MQEKVDTYREIRKKVYEEATKPDPYDEREHINNKERLKSRILQICSYANLDNFRDNKPESTRLLWYLMWSKIFYANRNAATINEFLESMREYFDHYELFSDPGWDCENSQLFMEYQANQGPFNRTKTYKSIPRVKKVVRLARIVHNHTKTGTPLISLFHNDQEDVWATFRKLNRLGYPGPLTTLHFMMDIGLPIMKPDITISRLFFHHGWLHDKIPNLPNDLAIEDLQGQGHYRARYHYTHKRMYKHVIDLARAITAKTNQSDLESDIGWVSSNPLREFDIFMAKAAQVADADFGLVRTLYQLTDDGNRTPARTCC